MFLGDPQAQAGRVDFVSNRSLGVLGSHTNGDVTGGFLNRVGPPLGAGPKALHGRSHVGAGHRNDQAAGVDAEVVLGIGHRRPQHLGYGSGGAVGHELEHDQGVAVASTPNLIEHTADLGHGTPHVAGVGKGLVWGEDCFGHLNELLSCP